MVASACTHESVKKFGKNASGKQRLRCKLCGKTWLEDAPQPLGDMRIAMKQATTALGMILEGMSLRATSRLTGLHLDTLGDLYTREENYDLALITLDEAMQILENRWGFDHFDFSETLQRLAALYAAMGLAGQAEEAYRRVLAIHAHTPFRPEQATERVALLRNLGLFYLDQANNQKAAKYLESAWQKCREGLPPDSQAYRDTMAAYEKLTQPKGF